MATVLRVSAAFLLPSKLLLSGLSDMLEGDQSVVLGRRGLAGLRTFKKR